MNEVQVGKLYRVRPQYQDKLNLREIVVVTGFKYIHKLVVYSQLHNLNRDMCDSILVFTRVYELFEGLLNETKRPSQTD